MGGPVLVPSDDGMLRFRPEVSPQGARQEWRQMVAAETMLRLKEELHLHPSDVDKIVVIEQLRLRPQPGPVDGRKGCSFNMRDKEAIRSPSNDRHLNPWLADGRQILGQV